MKFLRLDLLAYGHFTKRSLGFPIDAPGFHIIYGGNEAGKSTTLRAITGLLYGIEAQTGDAHLHPMQSLRIGGKLLHSTGAERTFIRKKGKVGTLLDENDHPVDEAVLRSWLSVGDRKQFVQMFGLSHEDLRLAGEALANAKTAAGEMLFGAALNGTTLQTTLAHMEEEARQLFSTWGHSAAVNRSLQSYREKLKLAKEKTLPTKEWDALRTELEKAELLEQEKAKEIVQAEVSCQHLHRLQKALSWIRRRAEALARLDALGPVRILSVDVPARRTDLQRELSDAAFELKRVQSRLTQLEQEHATLQVPEALLSSSFRVRQLTESLGSYLDEAKALPRITQEITTHRNNQREILKELGLPELSLRDVESIRVDEAATSRIPTLDGKGRELTSQLRQTSEDLAKKRAVVRGIAQQLDSLPRPPDISVLKDVWQQVQADRNAREKLGRAETKARAADESVRAALKALGLWSGSPEAAVALQVPSAETIQRFDDDLSDDGRERKRLQKQRQGCDAELELVRRELHSLAQAGQLPSEPELQQARQHRQQGWMHILRAWREQAPVTASVESYVAGQSLANAYDAAVVRADDLADLLRRESGRVAQYSQATEALARKTTEHNALHAELDALEEREDRRNREWRQAWAPCAITPLSPREMLRWRERYEEVLTLISVRREADRESDELRQTLAEHQAVLEGALRLTNIVVPAETPWATLLAQVKSVLDEAERRQGMLTMLQRDLSTAHVDVAALEERATALEGELTAWRKLWGDAVAKLRLGPDAQGSEADAVLKKLAPLFTYEKERQKQEKRLEAIKKTMQQFEDELIELVRQLAPDVTGSTEEQARAIIERHDRARDMAMQRSTLEKELVHRRQEVTESLDRLERAQIRWDALLRECGCSTAEELEFAEARSLQARALQQERERAEEFLFEHGEGRSLNELEQAVLGADADTLTAQLAAVENDLARLKEQHLDCIRHVGALQDRRRSQSGGNETAQLMTEAQEHLAVARSQAERYARLRVATVILQQAIENYRKRNEGAILRRASELFERLTRGRYEQLRVTFDDGKAKLRCVRKGQEVDIAGALSDGTLDQLFLALRLASIELHLQSQEPMPLVLDDIFIHFDDDRTRAGIEVLAEVAERTQVLLLTHHARNIELARQALQPSQWMGHQLNTAGEGDQAQVA